MRIEKINSNQIKCVLDKEELIKRHINVSELAYGSDKAQELFKDMMQQASYEFGFESGSAPLMIEAVPLSSDGIMLIITKVDNPDELDDKYNGLSFPSARTFKKKDDDSDDTVEIDTDDEHDLHTEPLNKEELVQIPENTISAFFVYSFDSLDDISDASKYLTFFDSANSKLYKASGPQKYILSIDTECVTKADCKVIRGTLSEYGEAIQCRKSKLDYFDEHYKVIVKENAIKVMSTL